MPTINSVASTMLSQALTVAGLTQVAWSGVHGAEHYRMTTAYDEKLAELASWANNACELVQLAAGWQRSQAEQPADTPQPPLTVVVSECPPRLWEGLDQLHRQGVNMLVIIVDDERQYCRAGKGAAACLSHYGDALGLYCAPPCEGHSLTALLDELNRCLQYRGVRIMHVWGTLSEPLPAVNYEASFSWANFPPGPYTPGFNSMATLESSALNRFVPELAQDESTIALWTRSVHPGPLLKLGARLQYCAVNGLVWQIAGLVANQRHPVVFLAAASIPTLLPGLMSLANCPVTLVILDGCCSLYNSHGHPQPVAKLHDLALLNTIPDITIAVPSDEEEAHSLMASLLRLPGLGVLRLNVAPALNMPATTTAKAIDIGQGRCLREGSDLSFVCLGTPVNVALLTAENLRSWGVNAGVYDMRFLRPLDINLLHDAGLSSNIITVEDHAINGGLGTAVLEAIAEFNLGTPNGRALKVGLDNDFLDCAPEDHEISLNSLVAAAKEILGLNARSHN